MKDWQLTLLGAAIGVIGSGLGATATYYYTKSLENDALRSQSIVGEHTLNSMGYLYFSALIHVFDFDHFKKVGKFEFANDSAGRKVNKGAYFAVLRQLQENASQIIKNQGYGKHHKVNQPDVAELAALRVRPATLWRITEFSEHESNGRELDEGERVAVEVLPVLGQSAAAVEPGDGAFDHPTPGLDDEALHPIGSLDDLGLESGQDAGQGAVKDRALIGAVGEQFPEKGKQTEQGRQPRETAVAILNVGGGDDAVQQQALRIDQNRPLLALDQLAGIEAVAVDASPPFSALFTL